ncbi:MAG: hypothetical protein IKV48_00585 [Eggerthellaceae bacterium]|nr:hypothetical protein [Eggerthellaceae bacterium]
MSLQPTGTPAYFSGEAAEVSRFFVVAGWLYLMAERFKVGSRFLSMRHNGFKMAGGDG